MAIKPMAFFLRKVFDAGRPDAPVLAVLVHDDEIHPEVPGDRIVGRNEAKLDFPRRLVVGKTQRRSAGGTETRSQTRSEQGQSQVAGVRVSFRERTLLLNLPLSHVAHDVEVVGEV